MTGDGFVFDAPAHDRWLPLPLEGDVDQEAAALVQRVAGHSASSDFLETTTAWVAGTTRMVRREVQRVRQELLRPTFAAWVLLPCFCHGQLHFFPGTGKSLSGVGWTRLS